MQAPSAKVRKLRPIETFLEISQNKFNFNMPCYWMLLESKEEVAEKQIEETLRILYRNIDILQLCIRKENSEYFFCEMNEERILLQVLKNQSLFEIFDNETHTNFDSATGPLWRATFIPSNDSPRESNCYTSNIMLTFNHAIIDGFTCFTICSSFLKVLNDVIGGKVEESYNFGEFNDGHETEELAKQKIESLNRDQECSETSPSPDRDSECSETSPTSPSPECSETSPTELNTEGIKLNDYFPVSGNEEKKTKFIHGEIDEETTKRLRVVFKFREITFNSGFSAAMNWGLMELLVEKGLAEEVIDLRSEHALNMRRYWKKHSTPQLGVHSGALEIVSKTDKNVGTKFWDYAKTFDRDMKIALENREGIESNPKIYIYDFLGPNVDFTKLLENYPPPKSYYGTTNMGDLTSIIQGRRDHVGIKWIKRAASVHGINACLVAFLHTYENRCLYCIAYSTHIVKDELANLFVERVIEKLKHLSLT